MILKKVKIYNYRQLQKVELDLQNSLTVLAGPNNSGKTTLISVLKGMFRDKKGGVFLFVSERNLYGEAAAEEIGVRPIPVWWT